MRRPYQYKTDTWILEHTRDAKKDCDKFPIKQDETPEYEGARVAVWEYWGNLMREISLRGIRRYL